MRIVCRLSALAIALSAASAAWASDEEANAVYARAQSAYAALDPALLESVYAPDATYLSRGALARISDRAAIRQGMGGFLDQLRARNGKLTIGFRIVERKRFEGLYVDNGYFRTVIDNGDGSTPSVSIGKFIAVTARQPDGRWAFVTDGDSDAPAAAYDDARPLPGVKFDQ